MTITQADEADLLARFAHVTEGPVLAVEDPCDSRDYKVSVEKPDRAGCVGTVICRAEHDWEYSRLSWKTAEANADYIAWAITNRLEIISAFTHREASEAPLKDIIRKLGENAAEAAKEYASETERLKERIAELEGALAARDARITELEVERDTPETENFLKAIPLEAAHQRSRWGADHDAGKTPFDWFWLIGYLAQKAASSAVNGDLGKAKHHTISTAAALANWHNALAGEDCRMRPGIKPPKDDTKINTLLGETP